MEIWYKPKYLLKSHRGEADPLFHRRPTSIDYQLDTRKIFYSNSKFEYNICEIFKSCAKHMSFSDLIKFSDINISFLVNANYNAFYPESFSNDLMNRDYNKKYCLTYEEFLIKTLLE